MVGDVGLAGVAIDSVDDMKVRVGIYLVVIVRHKNYFYRLCLMESHWIKCRSP